MVRWFYPLLHAYPNLRVTIQEVAKVLPSARFNLRANWPDVRDRVSFQVHDFFKPNPIKGDDVVYMARWIVHNWADQKAKAILEALSSVMTPMSRILLVEMIARPGGTSDIMCLSGITWSGFDNHYYLFTYEDTRDMFAIPHDIAILEAVFKVPVEGESADAFAKRPLYNKENKFWKAKSVADLVGELEAGEEKDALVVKMNRVRALYGDLSDTYQKSKGSAGIPLA
ncbi:hypothetical protein RQP46_000257 [Phenoliferia psychrophenolica]